MHSICTYIAVKLKRQGEKYFSSLQKPNQMKGSFIVNHLHLHFQHLLPLVLLQLMLTYNYV